MSKWTLLKDVADLHHYRDGVEKQWGLQGTQVAWSPAPTRYPVLIASLRAAPATVTTALVYPEAAQQLLAASAETPAAVDLLDDAPALPAQDAHNRGVVAHLMTMLHHLHRVAIVSPEDYSQQLTANLAKVDQWAAEDRDGFLAAGLRRPEDTE